HLRDLRLLPSLDHDQPRVGDGDIVDVVQRRHLPAVVDAHAVEERGIGAAGAHLRQLAAQIVQRHVDALAQVVQDVLCHAHGTHASCCCCGGGLSEPTSVPTSSPCTTRMMFPRWPRSNTMMGSSLSMQSEIAVESITLRFFRSTSM